MTKEEAKEFLINISYALGNMSIEYLSEKDGDRMREAIKALEQESTTDVLDKIRSEIENDWPLKKFPSSPFSCGLRRAIEIIDKYEAESEDKE